MILLSKLPDIVIFPSLVGIRPGRRTVPVVLFVLALLAILTIPQTSQAQGNPPDAPANPTATSAHNRVILGWDDAADDSITGHEYYQAQIARLDHLDLSVDDYFGWSVAVDGDVAVVGAPGDELETRLPGAAYVFTRESGVWTRVAELTASDGSDGDRFGVSVAVDGDTIVVSAKNHGVDSVDHGAVYVFAKPDSGWADANETAKLTPSDGADHDRFGAKVALAGDTVVVGAPHDDDGEDNRSVGSAYVFIKPGTGWADATETAKLTASDGDEYHQFGKSVATDGATVVVGAPRSFSPENPPGTAYVFVRPSDGWANATETGQLSASDGHDFDFFGESVGVDGDTILVGTPLNERDDYPSGAAYVFARLDSGWASADETGKLTPSDGTINNQFGFSVAVGGDHIVVSSVGDGEVGANGGAAYAYAEPTAGWGDAVETVKLTAPDASTSYRVGYSVAVDANTVFAGSLASTAYSLDLSAWSSIPNSGYGEANATSYTASSLINGLEYAYRIRAANDAGVGPASVQVAAMPVEPGTCLENALSTDTQLWAGTVRAEAGRSQEHGNEDYTFTWYEYGWWDERDDSDETCGGLVDGSETYLVRHISAGREELQSEKYGSYVNVGIHISFDRRPPQDLLDGASLNIGGTVLEFGDASTAMDNDREWYFGWYTALDHEPSWWSGFAHGGPVEVSVDAGE